MRKFLICAISVIILLMAAAPLLAETSQIQARDIAENELILCLSNGTNSGRVVDEAGLMSAEEANALRIKLDAISNEQRCDVIVVTTSSANIRSEYDAMVYADDFFDYNDYGYGSGSDGILLLVSVQGNDRFYWFSAHGRGSTAFRDSTTIYMGEEIVPYLKDGDYYGAFIRYSDLAESVLRTVNSGKAYSVPKGTLDSMWIFISIAAGVVVSFIITGIMKGKLKSVRTQATANSYIRSGSINITNCRDTFLYSRVRRTERVSASDGDSRSSHTSSSGKTHTGTGGSF